MWGYALPFFSGDLAAISARYLREAERYGHIPIWLIEVDADYCERTYADASTGCGQAVSLGGLGDQGAGCRCYNTRPTCPVPLTYSKTTKTFRLITGEDPYGIPPLVNAKFAELLPIISKIDLAAQEVDVEKSFTRTEHVKAILADYGGSPEVGLRPFQLDRDVGNHLETGGSWLRRWLQQFINLRGRRIRIYRGFWSLDWEYSDFLLIWRGDIKDFKFGSKNEVKLEAVDLFTGINTKVPPVIDQDNTLQENLPTLVDLSPTGGGWNQETVWIDVVDASQFTDPNELRGDATVVIRLGPDDGPNEWVQLLDVDTVGNQLQILRGFYRGRFTCPWRIGTKLTEVLLFVKANGDAWTIREVVFALLDLAKIPLDSIDVVQITRELEWVSPRPVKTEIDEGTSIRELMFEVIGDLVQGNLIVDDDLKIRLTLHRPVDMNETETDVTDLVEVNEFTDLANLNEEARITDMIVRYGLVEGGDHGSEEDYLSRVLYFNADTRDEDYLGPTERREINSRWIMRNDEDFARWSATRWGLAYRFPPWIFKWKTPLRFSRLKVGGRIRIDSDIIQDVHGNNLLLHARVNRKKWNGLESVDFGAQATEWQDSSAVCGVNDYNTSRYGFIHRGDGVTIPTNYDADADPPNAVYAYMAEDYSNDTSYGYLENFDRANEIPLAAPWIKREVGDVRLVSNRATRLGEAALAGLDETVWTVHQMLYRDWIMVCQVEFDAGSSGEAGIVAYDPSTSRYVSWSMNTAGFCRLGGDTLSYDGGVAPITPSGGVGYELKLVRSGNIFRGYFDGTQIAVAEVEESPNGITDTPYMGIFSMLDDPAVTVWAWDDWQVTVNDDGPRLGADRDPPFKMF